MPTSKAIWGAVVGALVAILWIALGGATLLLIIALTAIGWLIGATLDRPEGVIRVLERLQQR